MIHGSWKNTFVYTALNFSDVFENTCVVLSNCANRDSFHIFILDFVCLPLTKFRSSWTHDQTAICEWRQKIRRQKSFGPSRPEKFGVLSSLGPSQTSVHVYYSHSRTKAFHYEVETLTPDQPMAFVWDQWILLFERIINSWIHHVIFQIYYLDIKIYEGWRTSISSPTSVPVPTIRR